MSWSWVRDPDGPGCTGAGDAGVVDALRTLVGVRSLEAARAAVRPSSPAELARRLDPQFNVTPTIRLLSDVAVRSITGRDERDIVTTPPRTGKSQVLVIWTAVWALMQDPDLQIVVVAYADDLAQEHSRKARAIIREHGGFLGFQLAQDKTSVGRWQVEGRKGGLIAAGINSGVTGFGADCVSGDTHIVTEHGDVTAERAFREGHSLIWAFDHSSGVAGWHRVGVSRRIGGRDVVAVRTHGGRVLRCTSDHRVYTRRGYVPAGDLSMADEVLAVGGVVGVPPLWGGVSRDGDGVAQGGAPRPERDVLFARVPGRSFLRRAATIVLRGVRRKSSTVARGDVLAGVFRAALVGEARASGVPTLRCGVPSEVTPHDVLRQGVRGRSAFRPDDRAGQLALQDRYQLREVVPADEAAGVGARRERVRGLRFMSGATDLLARRQGGREVAVDHSPRERGSTGQPRRESDHDVLDVPCGAPQVGFDAVSSVGSDGGEPVSVYDFQVEGASNFFADGLLVHNCLIIDDPIKDQSEADSPAHRRRVLNEYRSTLATRVHPGGSICVVLTRWHEEDLAGALLKLEPDVWRHTNIPAIAEATVPDALRRVPGAVMTSALGFTPAHYAAMRRTSGERAWYSLYMGVPSAPEGGLVKQSWLDVWRLVAAPVAPVLTVVGVDPSDSGQGDSCGLVAASLTSEGVVAVIADQSAPMTSDEWARAAVQLAVDVGASEISVEGFSARETYTRVVREAIKRAGVRRPIRVSSWPPKGSGRGGGDAIARSSALLQALETGTCRLAGHFPELEAKAVLWQSGQHQPDSLAALVVGHDVLVHSVGREWDLAGPGSGPVAGAQSTLRAVPDAWMSQRVG